VTGKPSPWYGSVQPLHVYPEFGNDFYVPPADAGEGSWTKSAYYLTITTDDGVEGLYGPIDGVTIPVLKQQIKPFLLGQQALAGELRWDQLYRSNRHARSGHFMMAISAVDNALWDLRGRYLDAPVYQLLGGPDVAEVPVYASTLGRSILPGEAGQTAKDFREKGFTAQKWFMPYGPGDGQAGLRKNIDLVHELREAVGEETELMYDVFSGWDLPYALRWCEAVEDTRPGWLEEPFLMDQLSSYVELARRTNIPVATGEHLNSRWEADRMLRAGAMRVVQADPEWCGGVSELVKICTVASLYGARVVPHGHNLHAALHVVASQSPAVCPMGEFLYDKMQGYYHFGKYPLQPVDGKIKLPEVAGFGLDWDEGKVEEITTV
jgi:L-alanine-DL-glutamate epimerase-like enolase superfamily enzyme